MSFLGVLVIACLLAAVGVVTNSPVTVVGAMVVGPEFGRSPPWRWVLVGRRSDLVRWAAVALAVGFPVALAVTLVASLVVEAAGLVTVIPLVAAD